MEYDFKKWTVFNLIYTTKVKSEKENVMSITLRTLFTYLWNKTKFLFTVGSHIESTTYFEVKTGMFARKLFFSLIVFGGPEAPFLYLFSSVAPQRTAYTGVPSQMAAHPRIDRLL